MRKPAACCKDFRYIHVADSTSVVQLHTSVDWCSCVCLSQCLILQAALLLGLCATRRPAACCRDCRYFQVACSTFQVLLCSFTPLLTGAHACVCLDALSCRPRCCWGCVPRAGLLPAAEIAGTYLHVAGSTSVVQLHTSIDSVMDSCSCLCLSHCLFTQAALLLGLRATRRPAGYWDSLEVMDAELDAFVAGERHSTLTASNMSTVHAARGWCQWESLGSDRC
jgi:hypothetical protein